MRAPLTPKHLHRLTEIVPAPCQAFCLDRESGISRPPSRYHLERKSLSASQDNTHYAARGQSDRPSSREMDQSQEKASRSDLS